MFMRSVVFLAWKAFPYKLVKLRWDQNLICWYSSYDVWRPGTRPALPQDFPTSGVCGNCTVCVSCPTGHEAEEAAG